ncbi:conserved hypothetical protein [Verticillium alfalfae VaMs.102]|uniref:Uncharacterized protein n=1 Tax=Verticillium alfalfae (strain VaMs.102 / ATCC MYA-4576 / FGSC 10136) TaxID=526221 RepID=C9S5G9_VERA1|nr:conserved hypothetical protein [Verticillium alfalfae VaMs.102]EEY15046.1 conserved hypothetical protein [Verticillium alfalfae VaMs.102]
MAYNPYGNNPYGPPPTFGGYPGAAGAGAPGMAPPPGLGPPPGMSSAPGLAPPPGVQQSNNAQANRQSGLPPNFQAPNIPNNFDFSAPVIRLSALGGKPGPQGDGGRKDSSAPSSGRPGLGMDRRDDQSRNAARDNIQSLVPPTNEERLRTIFIHKIPEGLGADENIERLLNSVGRLRRWDSAASQLSDGKGAKFGFAQDPRRRLPMAMPLKVLRWSNSRLRSTQTLSSMRNLTRRAEAMKPRPRHDSRRPRRL